MTGCSGFIGMVLGGQLKCLLSGIRANVKWQVGPAGSVANDPKQRSSILRKNPGGR